MIKIFGAGMAGVLCANMMRSNSPILFEQQQELPDNHGALLRFRTNVVSRATGIPFKKVFVRKAVWADDALYSEPSIAHLNMYSRKLFGGVSSRSIANLEDGYRYIAPPNFIPKMAMTCEICFGSELNLAVIKESSESGEKIISTIPMPALMKIVGWKNMPTFNYLPIWSFSIELPEDYDVYQTIYYPEPCFDYYRASITGNRFILEYIHQPDDKYTALRNAKKIMDESFGLNSSSISLPFEPKLKYQKYGKLLPIKEDLRQEFILAMSDVYGIYSLGRFATWRQILLDDIVADVQKVETFISRRSNYLLNLESIKED